MPNLTPVLFFQEHQAQAVFNQTEDYVMFPDEATTSLCVWDSRNASRKQLLSLGHNGPVSSIIYSYTRLALPPDIFSFKEITVFAQGTIDASLG